MLVGVALLAAAGAWSETRQLIVQHGVPVATWNKVGETEPLTAANNSYRGNDKGVTHHPRLPDAERGSILVGSALCNGQHGHIEANEALPHG